MRRRERLSISSESDGDAFHAVSRARVNHNPNPKFSVNNNRDLMAHGNIGINHVMIVKI